MKKSYYNRINAASAKVQQYKKKSFIEGKSGDIQSISTRNIVYSENQVDLAAGCVGTLGTYGSFGCGTGCAGTIGTFACYACGTYGTE